MDKNFFDSVYIKKFSAWAPELETDEDWKQWSLGKIKIACTAQPPALEFTGPIFRRRLSQLSRMTVHVIHDCMPFADDTKIIFFSYWGEISAQLKINRMLISENDVLPAPFSLSVFNAAPALASIALGLTAGYTAIYPSVSVPMEDSFNAALQAAAAALVSGSAREILFVYADELIPPEYEAAAAANANEPLAFAVLCSSAPEKNSIPLAQINRSSARDFIASLYSQMG
jgi:hypothetical protein